MLKLDRTTASPASLNGVLHADPMVRRGPGGADAQQPGVRASGALGRGAARGPKAEPRRRRGAQAPARAHRTAPGRLRAVPTGVLHDPGETPATLAACAGTTSSGLARARRSESPVTRRRRWRVSSSRSFKGAGGSSRRSDAAAAAAAPSVGAVDFDAAGGGRPAPRVRCVVDRHWHGTGALRCRRERRRRWRRVDGGGQVHGSPPSGVRHSVSAASSAAAAAAAQSRKKDGQGGLHFLAVRRLGQSTAQAQPDAARAGQQKYYSLLEFRTSLRTPLFSYDLTHSLQHNMTALTRARCADARHRLRHSGRTRPKGSHAAHHSRKRCSLGTTF